MHGWMDVNTESNWGFRIFCYGPIIVINTMRSRYLKVDIVIYVSCIDSASDVNDLADTVCSYISSFVLSDCGTKKDSENLLKW